MESTMRASTLVASFAAALIVLAPLAATADDLTGKPAPEFKLQDQNGKWHTPADHKGQWVVLYFYPKDDTPGCTKQACTFRDDIFKFRAAGAEVLGVSVQDVASHVEFAKKYSLPFPLLADSDKKTATAYGVLTSYPVIGEVAKRDTFLIDPSGKIAKHYPGVKPAENSAEVLRDIEALKKTYSGG
jgi:thioredoxin-dependent peroxiredoxin